MKRMLLFFLIGITGHLAFSQSNALQSASVKKQDFAIYPNPAIDFIALNSDDGVFKINIYNLTGKQMKSFDVEHGQSYPVDDLPNGLYLAQLVGKNNKVLTTQRLNKRNSE